MARYSIGSYQGCFSANKIPFFCPYCHHVVRESKSRGVMTVKSMNEPDVIVSPGIHICSLERVANDARNNSTASRNCECCGSQLLQMYERWLCSKCRDFLSPHRNYQQVTREERGN
jgi:hypothetical protein